MSTTKHTPGPWKQVSELGLGPQLLIKANDALVATATSYVDARLIASAPELLEALKDATEILFRIALADAHKWVGDISGEKALEHANKVCAPARAIIARATGTTI